MAPGPRPEDLRKQLAAESRDFEAEQRLERKLGYLARRHTRRNPNLWLAVGALVFGLLGVLVVLSKGIGPGEGNGVRKVQPAPSASSAAPATRTPTIQPATPAHLAPLQDVQLAEAERALAELMCTSGVVVQWSDGFWNCWAPSTGPEPSRLLWSSQTLPRGSLAGDARGVYLAGDAQDDGPLDRFREAPNGGLEARGP